ncbi:integral membrane protein, partial [Nosema bombycis CQ1]
MAIDDEQKASNKSQEFNETQNLKSARELSEATSNNHDIDNLQTMDHNFNTNHNFNETHRPQVIREFYIVKEEPTVYDFIPLFFTFIVYAIMIQTICLAVKKINKPLYDNVIRVLLIIFPPLLLMIAKSYLFTIIWFFYASFMIYKYFKIKKKPIGKEVPRETYDLFKKLFVLTNLGIGICQGMLFISFFIFPNNIVQFFLLFVFFLYFGLLSREIILFFSETMAINTGFYSKEGVPGRTNNNSLCMICTKVFDNTETIHTLVCSHSFHEVCIKGW